MAPVVRLASLTVLITLLIADLALAQAGGGSGGFGGGGGGGGGVSGGRSGVRGDGGSVGGLPGILLAIGVVLLIVGLIGLIIWLKMRQLRMREERVHAAAAEAAQDDVHFAADTVEREAERLFRDCQAAWDARDRRRLAELVGEDLMVEWARRLDDFDRKGWHNRVEVRNDPNVRYLGLVNREDDSEDRAVVQIEAALTSYVLDRAGNRIKRTGASSEVIILIEFWTLARRDGRWVVVSIEQEGEGGHHLKSELVASPWADSRLADEALAEVAGEDKVPEGFTTADLAELDFEGDAHQRALDLSLANARFSPQLLEAAARRAVSAWAEAVDGDDAPLAEIASAEALTELLYGGDASRKTRLVVRGPRVKKIRVSAVDVATQPATMDVRVEVHGRRYVEDRDTTGVVSGSKDRAGTFTEQWRLALDGPDDSPWRLVAASAAPA
jgi:predicted lipid-binding transport protein (Tim44 family)